MRGCVQKMHTKVLLLFHFRSCDRPADQSFAWPCAATSRQFDHEDRRRIHPQPSVARLVVCDQLRVSDGVEPIKRLRCEHPVPLGFLGTRTYFWAPLIIALALGLNALGYRDVAIDRLPGVRVGRGIPPFPPLTELPVPASLLRLSEASLPNYESGGQEFET